MVGISRFRDHAGRDLPYLHGTLLVLGVLFPIGSLLASVLAPFNIGQYDINGITVSGPEFIRQGGLLVFWGASIGFGLLAYGIWAGRLWTRPYILWSITVLFMLGLALEAKTASLAMLMVLEVALILGILYWYLYRKRRTVAYYETLRANSPQAA